MFPFLEGSFAGGKHCCRAGLKALSGVTSRSWHGPCRTLGKFAGALPADDSSKLGCWLSYVRKSPCTLWVSTRKGFTGSWEGFSYSSWTRLAQEDRCSCYLGAIYIFTLSWGLLRNITIFFPALPLLCLRTCPWPSGTALHISLHPPCPSAFPTFRLSFLSHQQCYYSRLLFKCI